VKIWRQLDGRAVYGLQLIALCAVYTAAGKLGLDLAFASRSITAIWPPTGIALSALILGGYRLWPAIAVGAVLTNLNTGVPPETVFGIACGNTLEALTGAFLLRRTVDFDPSLRRVSDVLWLVALGAVVSTAVSATIGVTSLLVGGATSWSDAGSAWRTWWLGDMGGDLIVAPVLLIAATHRRVARPPGRPIEAAILGSLLVAVSIFVFAVDERRLRAVPPADLGGASLLAARRRRWQPHRRHRRGRVHGQRQGAVCDAQS
jgi:integral membrane sensor domain MASE1